MGLPAETAGGAAGHTGRRVRAATPQDLSALLALYAQARHFMAAAGNPSQWTGGYPGLDILQSGIAAGKQHILEAPSGEMLAAFFFDYGPAPEPAYARIEGAWLRQGPYGVLHRIAVAAPGTGAAGACLAWCFARSGGDLRADTHADNRPMQRSLDKAGFVRCGVIRLADGSPRWAYQKLGRPGQPSAECPV